MVTLSTSMLVVLLVAGAITVISMLSVFANVIGHETQLHDLRNRVKDLQFQHAMYIATISGQIPREGAVEILDEDGNVEQGEPALEVGIELPPEGADAPEESLPIEPRNAEQVQHDHQDQQAQPQAAAA